MGKNSLFLTPEARIVYMHIICFPVAACIRHGCTSMNHSVSICLEFHGLLVSFQYFNMAERIDFCYRLVLPVVGNLETVTVVFLGELVRFHSLSIVNLVWYTSYPGPCCGFSSSNLLSLLLKAMTGFGGSQTYVSLT
jgi:hypothetical protein